MHSREGVNQGDILAVLAYGIVFLLMIKSLKAAYTNVTQTWYADDSSTLGTFNNIGLYFNSLKYFIPGCKYYPKPPKIVLIVHPDNPAAGKEFGDRHGFKVCTSVLCLGGFIGDDKSKHEWLKY